VPIVDRDRRARSFGQVADLYQRGRPGYPPEAIEWLLGPEPLDVLDLGAGTGKLTAALLGDDGFDAVVAGSAIHWFDREPVLDEVARVLRPPGVFGLLGNRYDTSVDWQRSLRKLGGGGGGIYRADHWPSQPELRGRFAAVEDRAFARRMEARHPRFAHPALPTHFRAPPLSMGRKQDA
jgi:hypothetical protein